MQDSSLILIVGTDDDLLVSSLKECLDSETSVFVSEEMLFTTSFVFQQNGKRFNGFLLLNEKKIPFKKICGILLRIHRSWWPSDEFDLQDQMFVYHETIAAWFSLLSNIPCKVINRFALDWWMQDPIFPIHLCKKLSTALEIPAASYNCKDGVLPPMAKSSPSSSVYVIGNNLVSKSSCAKNVLDLLKTKSKEIAQWQEENGVLFCRLDFENSVDLVIRYVEAFPWLNEEENKIVKKILRHIVNDLL